VTATPAIPPSARFLLAAAFALLAATAEASVGLTELPADEGAGVVTIYYPSDDPPRPLTRLPGAATDV
jgi:hypothetical protein